MAFLDSQPIAPGLMQGVIPQVQPLTVFNPADLKTAFRDTTQDIGLAEQTMFQPMALQQQQESRQQALAENALKLEAAKAQQPNVLGSIKLQANLMSQLPEGSTQFDLETAKAYHDMTGMVPLGPDGKMDMDHMRKMVGEYRGMQTALQQAVLFKQALGSSTLPPEARIKTEQELADGMQKIDTHLNQLQRIRPYLNDSYVGPGWGAWYGRGAAQVGGAWNALTGGKAGGQWAVDKLTGQRQIMQSLANDILGAASQMKGNLSDKDVKFLREMFPKLEDTPQVWNEYFDRATRILAQGKANMQAQFRAVQSGQQLPEPQMVNWGAQGMSEPTVTPGRSAGPVIGRVDATKHAPGSRVKLTSGPNAGKSGVVQQDGSVTQDALAAPAGGVPTPTPPLGGVSPQPAPTGGNAMLNEMIQSIGSKAVSGLLGALAKKNVL